MKGFNTKAIHGIRFKQDVHGALRVPVYETVSFELGTSRDLQLAFEGKKPAHAYSRISNPTVEDFEQKVIFIGNGAITNPTMYYSKIGSTGSFLTAALTTVGNNVMRAKLPNTGYDFDYFIQCAVGGEIVTYPVTGGNSTGNINKTVITVEGVVGASD